MLLDIETNSSRQFASQIHQARTYLYFLHPSLAQRHQEILAAIERLRQYFLTIANEAEALEGRSLPKVSVSSNVFKTSTSASFDPHMSSLLRKGGRPIEGEASASIHYMQVENKYSNEFLSHSLEANVGNAKVEGEFELGIWNDKKFDPSLDLRGQLSLSLLSLTSHAKLGKGKVYATSKASVNVGSAKAVGQVCLSAKEQTLKLSGHVAALEGEAELGFHLFGATITLSGSASLMSAGADVSYSHKKREWEFGSKLGFIAGLGWKINIKY